ncbi:hypothetical protein KK566_004546 [Salmonella enterica]|nr:hypothetical protein [Salmonella enterica]
MNKKKTISKISEMLAYVLKTTTRRENACLYMSALLFALISDHLDAKPKLVTGTLSIGERLIFSHVPIKPILESGKDFSGIWDGHCWVEVQGIICDPSIFSTIFSSLNKPNLQQLFKQAFNGKPDYLIGSSKKLADMSIFYKKREELKDEDATLLIQSGYETGIFTKKSI